MPRKAAAQPDPTPGRQSRFPSPWDVRGPRGFDAQGVNPWRGPHSAFLLHRTAILNGQALRCAAETEVGWHGRGRSSTHPPPPLPSALLLSPAPIPLLDGYRSRVFSPSPDPSTVLYHWRGPFRAPSTAGRACGGRKSKEGEGFRISQALPAAGKWLVLSSPLGPLPSLPRPPSLARSSSGRGTFPPPPLGKLPLQLSTHRQAR